MQPVDMNSLASVLGRSPQLAYVMGEQNQRANRTSDLENQTTLEEIVKRQLENQVTKGSLQDLIAKQGISNEYTKALTGSVQMGTDEKRAAFEGKQSIPGYFSEQAKLDLSGTQLDNQKKRSEMLSKLALMSTDPVGFLNGASVLGVKNTDAEDFAKGYKAAVHGNWRNYVLTRAKENASVDPGVIGHQISAQNQRDIAGMQIASREKEAAADREARMQLEMLKKQLATNVETRIRTAKTFSEQKVIYISAAQQAADTGDQEMAAAFMRKAQEIEPEVAREKAAAGATTVNPQAIGGDILIPRGQAAQLPTGGQPQQAPSQRVRVQSPSGQIGTIPAEQLQQAIANGYKQVQ